MLAGGAVVTGDPASKQSHALDSDDSCLALSLYDGCVRAAACMVLALVAVGCDGGDGGDCTNTTVAILDPMPMQRIEAADDVDPSDATIQYEFVIEATCLAEDEIVELHLEAGQKEKAAKVLAKIRRGVVPNEFSKRLAALQKRVEKKN